MKLIVIAMALFGLSACQPPQSHVTPDGRACRPIGYSWAPIWVTPDGMRAC